eukprot:Plantae.Rhodophyta-Purpureofilum_apyrenoidigerum.ctg6746.p1 GENE.Plantae.Rhodophyta-Purpureofilum_apyrenoidigerum.ctg6746~~Plantae.Rhodophyta-Purpureofilum_apyrenoidigerum.ctg6746.p1  ORF type:complete len:206 (+),score=57.41 Plantae.Rhodophyta-Purpureofilum_apyrenoidigerum.ctg6746:58-675(+)
MWSVNINAFGKSGMPSEGGADDRSVNGYRPRPGADRSAILPQAPTSFPELEQLSLSELESLWSSEENIENFVQTHPHIRLLQNKIRELEAEVKELTKSNEAKLTEAQTSGSQEDAERERHFEAELRQQVDEKQRERERLWQYNSPDAILERLQAAQTDVENNSNDIKNRFLNREIELNEFINLFTKERKRYHQVAALIEQVNGES